MGAGRYFHHRTTGQLKIIYAYETAVGYEGNPLWREWHPERELFPPEPEYIPPPPPGPKVTPRPQSKPPAPLSEPESAPKPAIPIDTPEPEPVRRETDYPLHPRERRTFLMTAESRVQRNMADIVEQRFTHWLREAQLAEMLPTLESALSQWEKLPAKGSRKPNADEQEQDFGSWDDASDD